MIKYTKTEEKKVLKKEDYLVLGSKRLIWNVQGVLPKTTISYFDPHGTQSNYYYTQQVTSLPYEYFVPRMVLEITIQTQL